MKDDCVLAFERNTGFDFKKVSDKKLCHYRGEGIIETDLGELDVEIDIKCPSFFETRFDEQVEIIAYVLGNKHKYIFKRDSVLREGVSGLELRLI